MCVKTNAWVRMAYNNSVFRSSLQAAPKKSCRRTNKHPFRYCEKACKSRNDCKNGESCRCDGNCGYSCVPKGERLTPRSLAYLILTSTTKVPQDIKCEISAASMPSVVKMRCLAEAKTENKTKINILLSSKTNKYGQDVRAFKSISHGLNRFTSKSGQLQISPAATREMLHHTVWRTRLVIAYSDER